jgi:RNA polymerase sigma-70 factor (ECF subfamily)
MKKKVSDIQDIELIKMALENDQKAFSMLVARYEKSVSAYIQHFVIQENDAEDICQETFDKAFRNLTGYNPEYAFSTWLYSIAQNSCLDFFRKKRISTTELVSAEIKEGGSAMEAWFEKILNARSEEEKSETAKNLLKYCHMDTYAMYAIWKELIKIIS